MATPGLITKCKNDFGYSIEQSQTFSSQLQVRNSQTLGQQRRIFQKVGTTNNKTQKPASTLKSTIIPCALVPQGQQTSRLSAKSYLKGSSNPKNVSPVFSKKNSKQLNISIELHSSKSSVRMQQKISPKSRFKYFNQSREPKMRNLSQQKNFEILSVDNSVSMIQRSPKCEQSPIASATILVDLEQEKVLSLEPSKQSPPNAPSSDIKVNLVKACKEDERSKSKDRTDISKTMTRTSSFIANQDKEELMRKFKEYQDEIQGKFAGSRKKKGQLKSLNTSQERKPSRNFSNTQNMHSQFRQHRNSFSSGQGRSLNNQLLFLSKKQSSQLTSRAISITRTQFQQHQHQARSKKSTFNGAGKDKLQNNSFTLTKIPSTLVHNFIASSQRRIRDTSLTSHPEESYRDISTINDKTICERDSIVKAEIKNLELELLQTKMKAILETYQKKVHQLTSTVETLQQENKVLKRKLLTFSASPLTEEKE